MWIYSDSEEGTVPEQELAELIDSRSRKYLKLLTVYGQRSFQGVGLSPEPRGSKRNFINIPP